MSIEIIELRGQSRTTHSFEVGGHAFYYTFGESVTTSTTQSSLKRRLSVGDDSTDTGGSVVIGNSTYCGSSNRYGACRNKYTGEVSSSIYLIYNYIAFKNLL